jgi:hypothetical protein
MRATVAKAGRPDTAAREIDIDAVSRDPGTSMSHPSDAFNQSIVVIP